MDPHAAHDKPDCSKGASRARAAGLAKSKASASPYSCFLSGAEEHTEGLPPAKRQRAEMTEAAAPGADEIAAEPAAAEPATEKAVAATGSALLKELAAARHARAAAIGGQGTGAAEVSPGETTGVCAQDLPCSRIRLVHQSDTHLPRPPFLSSIRI